MTKKLTQNYTFDKANRQITILGENNITLDKLLLITNLSTGDIIFNFADNTKTATILNNIITLEYDTTLMDNSDILQIWVEDTSPLLIDFSSFFSMIRNLLSRLSFDATSQLRVIISSLPTVNAVTTANAGFGDSGKYATQQLISQNIVSNSYNRNIVRS